jgi:hypothetical protein
MTLLPGAQTVSSGLQGPSEDHWLAETTGTLRWRRRQADTRETESRQNLKQSYEPPIPLRLHLARRRPPARRLQAIGIRQGYPAVYDLEAPLKRKDFDPAWLEG